MRKKGLIFLLVTFAIIIAVMYLLTDRWMERQMESAGSAIVGAKVEFDGIDFTLFKLQMKWNRLQVTDPNDTWKNLFETGKTEFRMDLEPLLTKKIIIENLQLEELRFDTKRETDGKLPEKTEEEKRTPEFVQNIQKHLANETTKMPVFNLRKYTKKVNVDSLWKMVNLKSPDRIDSLKKSYIQKYDAWDRRLNTLPTEKDLNDLKNQINSIQLTEIKTISSFQENLTKVNNIYKKVESVNNNVRSIKSDFQSDLKQLKSNRQVVPQWIQQDYKRVLNIAQIPDISVKNVANLLFGSQIINKIQTVNGYLGRARYYSEKLKSGQPKKESPPRMKGQDIKYSSKRNWPGFWIKNISLSGIGPNEFQIAGTVKNIVSRQKLIGEPTAFSIDGTRKDQASLKLAGIFNYLEEEPSEEIDLAVMQIPLSKIKLTEFPLLPYKIDKGKGGIDAKLQLLSKGFKTNIQFTGSNIRYDFSEKPSDMNERLVSITRSIAESITLIRFEARASQIDNKFNFTIKSNLDKLIADRVKEILSGEIAKARQKLEARVRDEAEKYRKEFEALVAEKEKQLQAHITKVETEIQNRINEVENKKNELKNHIEEEKKKQQKKLEDEAKKKLKDLFKK